MDQPAANQGFGQRVAHARRFWGLSTLEIELLTDGETSAKTIWRWERVESINPSLPIVRAFCLLVGVTPTYLLTGQGLTLEERWASTEEQNERWMQEARALHRRAKELREQQKQPQVNGHE